MNSGGRRRFLLRRLNKKNPNSTRSKTPTGMPTPNPIFRPELLPDVPRVEGRDDEDGAIWASTICVVILVKLTPAESITTDVMRMTLETGTSLDVVASAASLSDGLSIEDTAVAPVDEGGVAEGEREV